MASKFFSWKDAFKELFNFRDKWEIYEGNIKYLPDISKVRSHGWKQFQDKGKDRFECGRCRKMWSSAMGVVIFHYRLKRNHRRKGSRGEVKLWCFGQKCKDCRGNFEEPYWYDEEIERILRNLLIKVKEKFYGGSKRKDNPNQLLGDMSAGHEQALCSACQEGVCGRRDGNAGSKKEEDEEEMEYDDEEDEEDDCSGNSRDFFDEQSDNYDSDDCYGEEEEEENEDEMEKAEEDFLDEKPTIAESGNREVRLLYDRDFLDEEYDRLVTMPPITVTLVRKKPPKNNFRLG